MSDNGEIEITLGHGEAAKKEILKPTLRAARVLDQLGGVIAALDQVKGYRLSAYAAIIAAGTGRKHEEIPRIEKLVYETGMLDMVGPLSNFVTILGNGGRPLPDLTDADLEGAEPGES